MVTDPLFYRIFETSPEMLFLVLGISAEAAQEKAAQYEYDAIEFKETSHRVDGIFRPKRPGLPLYVPQAQKRGLARCFIDRCSAPLRGHATLHPQTALASRRRHPARIADPSDRRPRTRTRHAGRQNQRGPAPELLFRSRARYSWRYRTAASSVWQRHFRCACRSLFRFLGRSRSERSNAERPAICRPATIARAQPQEYSPAAATNPLSPSAA